MSDDTWKSYVNVLLVFWFSRRGEIKNLTGVGDKDRYSFQQREKKNMSYEWRLKLEYCPVGWGCRIHHLLYCRGVRHLPTSDTKKYDGEVPVILKLWGMRSTPSLPLLLGLLWPGVVAPDRGLSMRQIELNCVLMLNWIAWNRTVFDIETVLTLNWIVWNRTVLTFNCV